jgi:CRISPR/Cas system-associated protein Cas7 (RAMP superfamily)
MSFFFRIFALQIGDDIPSPIIFNMIVVETSNITFYNKDGLIAKFDVEADTDIERIISEEEALADGWEYFEYYSSKISEEDMDTRSFKREEITNIRETYAGWFDYLKVASKMEEEMEKLKTINPNGQEHTDNVSGPSGLDD